MRVIAGELKGQQLMAPKGWKVRPTSERVREAIFSTLAARIAGAEVLDLYCGTGALAIEALSRGAARATMVDHDTRPALGNVQRLGLADRVDLIRADAGAWLAARARRAEGDADLVAPTGPGGFDLVFVDAPYKLADLVAEQLDTHLPGVLAAEGRAVVESGARRPLVIASLEQLRQRRYGAADVSIYGRAAA
jgi:16S rRNA (guanine966-N2)-methyltransferase